MNILNYLPQLGLKPNLVNGMLFSSFASGVRGPSSLLSGLVSYWKLDEESGTRQDSHGVIHLTDNNTVGSVAGKIGNAADFIAANSEYLSVASNTSLQLTSGSFTISCWVQIDDLSLYREVIGKITAWGGNVDYSLSWSADFDWEFRINNDAGTSFTAGPFAVTTLTGTWYHLLATYDAATKLLTLYRNNAQHGNQGTLTGTPQVTTAEVRFGSNRVGTYFDGKMDEVGFWSRVLTDGERTQLYNGGAGITYPF